MNDKVEIEKYAVNLFSDVTSHGYSKPIIDKEHWWNTTISWLRGEVGLEMVLDWREQAVDFFSLN